MNKRGIKNTIISIVLIAYIVLYRLVIFPQYMKYSAIITSSFLVVLLALSIWFLGFRRDKPTFDSRNITRNVIFYLFLTFVLMYGLGFIVGFLKNAYSRNFLTLLDNIVAPILTIIFVEIIRYVVIWANRDKKVYITFFTVILIVLELFISIRSLPIGDAAAMFDILATIILPVIIKNSVMSYLCYHIGYKVPLLYRLVMDVYIFIVPIIPDIGDYLNSMILIALPIVIYINAFAYIDERNKKAEYYFEEKSFSIWDIPVAAFLIVLAALISGFFPHYMIGVGSDSMNPTIHKGDAVILKKVDAKTLKQGDIIAFQNTENKRLIVHRIDSITSSNDNTVYVTKGDANNSVDANVVYPDQVRGVVKVKIPYIAYPTLWLSEYFIR